MDLTVIAEGGITTYEYLRRNGLHPSKYGFSLVEMRQGIRYYTPKDDILIILHSLTDFTMEEVYSFMEEYKLLNVPRTKGEGEEEQPFVGRLAICSDISLGNVDFPYYLYEGDLFYGKVKKVDGGKVTDVVWEEDKEGETKRRKGRTSTTQPELILPNAFMRRYLGYKETNKNKRVRFSGLDAAVSVPKEKKDHEQALRETVKQVNLFR